MESSQAATQGCPELVSRDLHHLVSSPRVSFEFPKGEKRLHFKCLMIHRLIYGRDAPLFCCFQLSDILLKSTAKGEK